MALAVFYEVRIVIISLAMFTEELPQETDYHTLIMDATDYSATKALRVESAPGIKIISKEEFPNTIELCLSQTTESAHFQFLWRREIAPVSHNFPSWSPSALVRQQQASSGKPSAQATTTATAAAAEATNNQAKATTAEALQSPHADADTEQQ